MVNIENARVMVWSAAGLLIASVGATGALVWNVAQFVAHERDSLKAFVVTESEAQAERMADFRDELAEIGDGLSVQAAEMRWLRDLATSIRDEQRRLEANTASELREVRADIRALNGAKREDVK